MEKIKISIIDDHEIVRQGLKDLLEKLKCFEVISEYENGQLFLDSLPLANQPDVFILDYSMPNMNGIQVLKALEEKNEEYKVLLLTQHFDESIINNAYMHGARGFLHKNCSAHELKSVLENIANVGYDKVADILKRIKNYDPKDATRENIMLTPREIEFLELVCSSKEHTYEQMSDLMGVSIKSIDVYRQSLFEKFNIKSKVGLVLMCYKYRLTHPFL